MKFMTVIQINDELMRLRVSERKITHEILKHILLFEKCAGYLKLGYSSMLQYLIRHLGYSEDAAYRRLHAAHLLTQVPDVEEKIKNGEINLTQASIAQKAFEQSKKETGQDVKTEFKKQIIDTISNSNNFKTKETLAKELNLKPEIQEKIKPQSDESYRLEITLNKKQFENLKQIKSLLSHQVPNQLNSEIFDFLMEFYLKKKSFVKSVQNKTSQLTEPIEVNKNHNQMNQVNQENQLNQIKHMNQVNQVNQVNHVTHVNHVKVNTSNSLSKENSEINNKNTTQVKNTSSQCFLATRSRYISVKVKRALYTRSKGQCEFVSENGVRCSSQYQLQVDHIVPFSLGGSNTYENTRLCCKAHNAFLATQSGIGYETIRNFNSV